MKIKDDIYVGKFSDVYSFLRRSISQYTRHYSEVKIGITNDPEIRKMQHYKSNPTWDFLVVKYRTSSVNFVNKMEKLCIEYHWKYIVNERNGGGGRNGKTGPYYLYVLLKK